MAKRVVLELGSSTNFVYSLNWGRGIFKNPPAPIKNALSLIDKRRKSFCIYCLLQKGKQGVTMKLERVDDHLALEKEYRQKERI